MAQGGRKAQPPKLTPYERRIVRATGMLPAQARARGISLAKARGHAPRAIEPGGERIPEHRLRDIRRQLRGEPTEAERRYLRAQSVRSGIGYEELKFRFMSKTQTHRDLIRQRAAQALRYYTASKKHWRWLNDAPSSWGPSPNGRDPRAMAFVGDMDDFPSGEVESAFLYYH